MAASADKNYKGVWDSRLGFGKKSAIIVIDLLQAEDIGSHLNSPLFKGLIQFIFIETALILQAPVFLEITGEKKGGVTCSITVIAVTVTGAP